MNCYILGDLRTYFKVLHVQKKFLTRFLDNYCPSPYLREISKYRQHVSQYILNIMGLLQYYVEKLGGLPLISTSNTDIWNHIQNNWNLYGNPHPIEITLYPFQNLLIYGTETEPHDISIHDGRYAHIINDICDYYRRL